MPKSTDTRMVPDWERTVIPLIKGMTDTELTPLKFSDARKSQMMEILQVMPKSVS